MHASHPGPNEVKVEELEELELDEEEDFTEETVKDEDDEEEDDFCRLEMVCSVCLLLSVVFLVGVEGILLSEDDED